jgi:adenylyltransferase/sulfurtransferase
VLVVGVGGLGCPAALYLAGAGVGSITLCDPDVVSVSNLHRQILFDARSVGLKKVHVARARLLAANPMIQVVSIDRFADAEVLSELVARHDLVLDGTDNFTAKYTINDVCQEAGVPLVYGSIFQFEGQVSVFHLKDQHDGRGFSYRDLYPDAPPAGLVQNCGEAGVIGVLPGVVGTLQANEAIKVLTGVGKPLSGTVSVFDALSGTATQLKITRRQDGRHPAPSASEEAEYESIDSQHLQQMLNEGAALLDVRSSDERISTSLGGLHVELSQLAARIDEIPDEGKLVVYCKSGARSAMAALYLRSVKPNLSLFNLSGGIDAALSSQFHYVE